MTKRVSKNDRAATKAVAAWFKSTKERAACSVTRDVDLRLVAMDYSEIPGMGAKVVTMRTGSLVAWFDSHASAQAAILMRERAT